MVGKINPRVFLKLIEAIEKGAESAQIASVKGNAKSG
jgi:hypothetical protein